MGYYTEIDIALKANKNKIAELRQKIEALKRKAQTGKGAEWFFYYGDIRITEDNSIEFTEYSRKWYEEEQFYNFIKDFVEEGFIQGHGEVMDDVWRVVFDGKGNWKMQTFQFVDVPDETFDKIGMSQERQLAADIIDEVEEAILEANPGIDVEKKQGNTLLYEEVYYALEDSIMRQLEKTKRR